MRSVQLPAGSCASNGMHLCLLCAAQQVYIRCFFMPGVVQEVSAVLCLRVLTLAGDITTAVIKSQLLTVQVAGTPSTHSIYCCRHCCSGLLAACCRLPQQLWSSGCHHYVSCWGSQQPLLTGYSWLHRTSGPVLNRCSRQSRAGLCSNWPKTSCRHTAQQLVARCQMDMEATQVHIGSPSRCQKMQRSCLQQLGELNQGRCLLGCEGGHLMGLPRTQLSTTIQTLTLATAAGAAGWVVPKAGAGQ